MKTGKSILYLAIALTMAFTSVGCKKYSEDTGLLSLRSRTERISNTWVIDNYKINGSDYTSLAQDYVETFSKSGSYTYSWELLNGSGSWAFQNDDEEVKLTGDDDHSSRTLFILKLDEKSFWYYYIDEDDDRHEFHLIEKRN